MACRPVGHHLAMTTVDDVHQSILGLRRGNNAVILMTYRGDW